ncbi:MAG: hypothetical protein FJY88_08825, partial [Candidatus Eisenbacteria bacterium]|nr:hypothetical protein [Candidatus Eisenbacteria bacterium]
MKSTNDKSAGGAIRFLIGPAGSGKSSSCLEGLCAHEGAGREAFYLVPEQSTYLADRQMLEPPLPAAIRHVRALSFRRLAAILDIGGEGGAPRALDRAGRRILLRSLLDSLAPALRSPFEPLLDRQGFIDAMIGVIRDLRFEAGSFADADIERIGATGSIPQDLQRKLSALSSLRRLYEKTLVERNLQDPDLALLELPERIRRDPIQWAGRPVIVDGFLSFTSLEAETLQRIAEAGASMTITLCLDGALAGLLPLVPPPPPPG